MAEWGAWGFRATKSGRVISRGVACQDCVTPIGIGCRPGGGGRQLFLACGEAAAHGFHLLLRAELADVLTVDPDRRTHFQQAVIDARVGEIRRVLQLLQRQIRRDDQRLSGAVTTVHDVEHLRHSKLRAVLHAKVIEDQKAVGVQAFQEGIALAGVDANEGVHQLARTGHQHRDAAVEQGVRDAGGKEGFPCAHAAPQEQSRAGFEHLRKLLDIGPQLRALRLVTQIIREGVLPKSGILQPVRFQLPDLRHPRPEVKFIIFAIPLLGLALAEAEDGALLPEQLDMHLSRPITVPAVDQPVSTEVFVFQQVSHRLSSSPQS